MRKPRAKLIDPRAAGRVIDVQYRVLDGDVPEAASGVMEEWLDADIDALQQARLTAERADWTLSAIEALEIAAHEVKAMSATCGFALAAQLAGSLCRLIGTDAGKRAAQRDPALVRVHIDAVRAAARQRIRDDKHETARAVVQALQAQIARLGVAPR